MKERKLFKSLIVISTLAILLASVSSCKKPHNNIDKENKIEIKDSLGNTFYLDKEPTSVVILESSLASIYKLAGGTYSGIPSNYEEYDLSLDNALNIGDYKTPNKELILSLKPDLIIYSTKSSLEGHKAIVEELKSLNMNINFYGVDINSFEDYLYTLNEFTKITGHKDAFQTYGLNIKEEIDSIVSNVPNIQPKVLFIRARSNAYDVISSDNFVVSMLKDLNTINIGDNVVALKDSARIVNEEYILNYNPDYIFIVYMGNATTKIENNLQSALYEKAFYPLLNAVKNNHVYILDKKIFNNKPNEKWAIAYKTLYNYLYGEN